MGGRWIRSSIARSPRACQTLLGLLVDLCVGGMERQIDVAGAEPREPDLHRAGVLPAGQVEGDGELDGGGRLGLVLARSMSSSRSRSASSKPPVMYATCARSKVRS